MFRETAKTIDPESHPRQPEMHYNKPADSDELGRQPLALFHLGTSGIAIRRRR